MLGRAEEGLNAQGMVGTEVEIIKQQLQEFKVGWTSRSVCSESVCVSVFVQVCVSVFVQVCQPV